MMIIRLMLIAFVLVLALVLGHKIQLWSPLAQLTQALQFQPLEDRAGKPVNQR